MSNRPETIASQKKYAEATGAVTAEVHESDHIFNWLLENPVFDSLDSAVQYYFNDGRKSAHKLKALFERFPTKSAEPSLLEFASGYGCVSRHVANAMPHVSLTSCDIHSDAVEFLSEHIPGTRQVLSRHAPEQFAMESQYDYVFALSFFSHMPRSSWGRWLRALYAAVKPGGYLLFTTQGEASRQFHGTPEIPEDGFWFVAQSEQVDLDVNEYGQTIVTPSFAVPKIAAIETARLVGLDLRGWWEHQDLYIVRKER